MNDCANNKEVTENDENSNIDQSNDDDSRSTKVEKDFLPRQKIQRCYDCANNKRGKNGGNSK